MTTKDTARTTAERILDLNDFAALYYINIDDLKTIARAFLEGQEWVAIKSEGDLPKEEGYYLTFLDIGFQKIIQFVDGAWNIDFYRVTHYRPLPPDPPLPEDEEQDSV